MSGKIQDRIRQLLSRMSKGKGIPTKETMLILFLSGILIFVILLPTGSGSSYTAKRKSQKSETSEPQDAAQTDESLSAGTSMEEYRKGLERELEDFLSSVSGVGEVKVLIYMKDSQKYIVEKDVPEQTATDGARSEQRKEEATVYTVNESGNQVPFVAQTRRPAIDGVVISAEGAGNEAVKLQIVRLVMALYGVEANKVEVLVMG